VGLAFKQCSVLETLVTSADSSRVTVELKTVTLGVLWEVRPENISFSSTAELVRIVSSRLGNPRWTGDTWEDREIPSLKSLSKQKSIRKIIFQRTWVFSFFILRPVQQYLLLLQYKTLFTNTSKTDQLRFILLTEVSRLENNTLDNSFLCKVLQRYLLLYSWTFVLQYKYKMHLSQYHSMLFNLSHRKKGRKIHYKNT
jgi:hypothetical protein